MSKLTAKAKLRRELDAERAYSHALEDLVAERDQQSATLAAMVVRAAREVRDPVTRANLLADLVAVVPDVLEGEPDSMQPDELRQRVGL